MLSRLNQGVLFFLLALLFFVWPISHTGSIRQSVFYLLLCVFVYLTYRKGLNPEIIRSLKVPLALFGFLTIWIFIVAFFFSEELAWTLKEISGTWIRGALFALSLGMMVPLVAERSGLLTNRNLTLFFFAILMVSITFLDIYAISDYIKTGYLPMGKVGVFLMEREGPDKMSILSLMALSFVFVDILSRLLYKKHLLPVGKILLAVLLAMILFSLYVEYMRSAFIVAMALMLSALLIYLFISGIEFKKVLITLLILSVICALGVIHVKEDREWQTFQETISIALDTEGNHKWLDYEGAPPVFLKDGTEVSYSNYLRIAWFKEGLILVKENPLGVGFGRGAFGIGLISKYGEGSRGATTHSGLLDLTIGIGIIGALAWVLFLVSVVVIAFKVSRRRANYFALLLMFIVVDFSVRMVLDSIIRDHMLQQFLFLLGFLLVLTVMDQQVEKEESTL